MFSIKEIEQITGIKAHTIRIWEKRYNILIPNRSETNIRSYCDEDLKKILNIAALNRLGFKISRLSSLNNTELGELVSKNLTSNVNNENAIDALLLSTFNFDEESFKGTISTLCQSQNFQDVLSHYIFPFQKRVGIQWQVGDISPAHEHFASHLVREILHAETSKLPLPSAASMKYVLFLPENEYHDIPLLAYNYLLRTLQRPTIYLGQSIPHQYLAPLAYTSNVKAFITSITTHKALEPTIEFINELSSLYPNSNFIVICNPLYCNHLESSKKVRMVADHHQFLDEILND